MAGVERELGDRAVAEKIEGSIADWLQQANNHWEEVFWWMLARNFGARLNADIFEAIARSTPVNILARHKNQIHQLEALLLGQAGLLDGTFEEHYPNLLKREYLFYAGKYGLSKTTVKPFFLRMRPANFPTLRLAQLAMLINKSTHLFSKVLETTSINELQVLLNVTANDYWHYHYMLDEAGTYKPKQLGRQMIDNLIINTLVPVVFAYGEQTGNNVLKEKALQWLAGISAEKNTITKKWVANGVNNLNALESQALIELKNHYCNVRACLQCSVGNVILGGKVRAAP